MKTFTKALALALFATTAIHAMDNQPRQNWQEKVKGTIASYKLGNALTMIGGSFATGLGLLVLPDQAAKVVAFTLFGIGLPMLIGPDHITEEDLEDLGIKNNPSKKDQF